MCVFCVVSVIVMWMVVVDLLVLFFLFVNMMI